MCLHCLGLAKLCPPDCLVKSDIKAPSCAAIFRLGIVVLQCVRTGEVFCGLHVAHVHIICPVRDVTHARKCTRPSPAFPYCKRLKAGRGPGNEANRNLVQMTSLRERPLLPSYFPSILSTFPIHVSWEPDQSYPVKMDPVVSLS